MTWQPYLLKVNGGKPALYCGAGGDIHKRRCLHRAVDSVKLALPISLLFFISLYIPITRKLYYRRIASPKEKELYFSFTATSYACMVWS